MIGVLTVNICSLVPDVNECAGGSHGCQHTCTNTAGSYTCRCRTGYSLSGNGRSCIGKRNSHPELIADPSN